VEAYFQAANMLLRARLPGAEAILVRALLEAGKDDWRCPRAAAAALTSASERPYQGGPQRSGHRFRRRGSNDGRHIGTRPN